MQASVTMAAIPQPAEHPLDDVPLSVFQAVNSRGSLGLGLRFMVHSGITGCIR